MVLICPGSKVAAVPFRRFKVLHKSGCFVMLVNVNVEFYPKQNPATASAVSAFVTK